MSQVAKDVTLKLRFPEFQDELVSTSLSELTKKKISYGIVQAGPHVPDGMPYIKSQNLNEQLDISLLERTSDEIARKYRRSEVVPGDIVFSLRGNIGVSKIVPPSIPVANLTQGTARISVSDQFSNEYVLFNLQTQKVLKRILAVSKGSTFQEISLFDLRQIMLVHPQLEEQRKIADFLTAVSTKIDTLHRKRTLLTDYKRGVMQKLFTQEIRFVGDGERPFPDWEERPLSDFVINYKGGAPLTPSDFVEQSNSEVVPKKAVVRGGFLKLDETNPTFCTDEFFTKYDKSVIDDSYMITTLRDLVPSGPSIGLIVTNPYKKKMILAQGVYGFRLTDKLNPKFLTNISNTNDYRKLMIRLAVGSTQIHIRTPEFFGIKLNVPCIEEQKKIADFFDAIDQKITAVDQQFEQMATFKKGLLQQMFV